MSKGLVYVGKIIDLQHIEGADFIVSATVVCGEGGKWRGIVRKTDFALHDLCIVFLPDSQLDPKIHDYLPFMKDSNWRVKMRRFRGAPSEVLIITTRISDGCVHIGKDVTHEYQVTKYCKPIPAHLQGLSIGDFPSFIPKTDEPNYQTSKDMVDKLVGQPYYITEKCDGSSTTAYRYKGHFGVCSRNLELERNENNGYWKVALKYKLEENLPEGYAIQWETCGPGVQSNPMSLDELDGFAFSVYDINEHCYLECGAFVCFTDGLMFPTCKVLDCGESFSKEDVEFLGEGKYSNGKQREGVVVRSQHNFGHAPISFKVINLDYEK
jgi:RNA ligase (TIGR02306 family)